MTSALSDNLPPGKTLETATRTALAGEEKIYHILNEQKLAQKIQLDDARSSIYWLSSALDATQVAFDSSADVVSALNSFIANLSSAIWIHGSRQLCGDLRQSLPSTDAAKRTWESVTDIVDNLLVQIESLKSTTSSHIKCIGTELGAHKSIEEQTQISLDSLTQCIDTLSHSMDHKRSIFHPIRRLPTEILERIFELATLDERLTLQKNLGQPLYPDINGVSSTIPRVPTTLASTCCRWRTIALSMAPLWSFLRVPTSERYVYTFNPFVQRTCIVGRSTFQLAKSCNGASKCEVVVSLTTNNSSMVFEHLRSIPGSQISTMNIVLPPEGLDLSRIPPARVLHIFGGDRVVALGTVVSPPSYPLPVSVLANTRELNCHHALPVVNAPIHSVTSFSLSLKNDTYFPDLGRPLANFPNLTAVVLDANVVTLHPQRTFTPLHPPRIRTLSITDTIIPHLCASLQRGALSFPSLTHFILLDIFPSISNNRGEWGQLQSLLFNVTCFEIRAATQQGCGSNIRQLLDAMPLLQQFAVFGDAVNDGLQALRIGTVKQIGKLVVSDSETDGSNAKSYYDALSSESANRLDDHSNISIQFVNCPCILPQIREQISSSISR